MTPGADVLNAIPRRKPMAPLPDASLGYLCGGTLRRRRGATLLFNRECADWLALTDDEAIDFPELPLPVNTDPLVKDFTGHVLTFQDADRTRLAGPAASSGQLEAPEGRVGEQSADRQ